MSVAGHALRLHATVFHSLQQRTARLAVVLAVAKTAAAEQVLELDEAGLYVIPADMAEAEFANPGRVDQLAATGEVEQPRGGGGVRALSLIHI